MNYTKQLIDYVIHIIDKNAQDDIQLREKLFNSMIELFAAIDGEHYDLPGYHLVPIEFGEDGELITLDKIDQILKKDLAGRLHSMLKSLK